MLPQMKMSKHLLPNRKTPGAKHQLQCGFLVMPALLLTTLMEAARGTERLDPRGGSC